MFTNSDKETQSRHPLQKGIACGFTIIKSAVTFLVIQLACLHCATQDKLAQYFVPFWLPPL